MKILSLYVATVYVDFRIILFTSYCLGETDCRSYVCRLGLAVVAKLVGTGLIIRPISYLGNYHADH
jgi:hypothetical protein